MKNKVMIISSTQIVSGAEIVLKDYIETNENFDFIVVTSTNIQVKKFYSDMKNVRVYHNKNITNYHLRENPYKIFQYFYSLFMGMIFIKYLVKKESPDLLYGNNSADLGLLLLYKLFSTNSMKIICHIHNSLHFTSVSGFIARIFGKYIDAYIVPSMSTKKTLDRLIANSKKINVIYNGVADKVVEDKNKENEKYIRIGFVGAITPRKRPDLFLEIITELKKINVPYKATIIGSQTSKDLLAELENKIDEEDLQIDILEPLPHEKMGDYYQSIDFLVLTSDSDPLPTVILESMARGVFVVARDVDGVSEIIDNTTGILFKYEFDAKTVAKSIVEIFKNHNTYLKMTEQAKKRVQSVFTYKKKSEQVDALILKLIREGKK